MFAKIFTQIFDSSIVESPETRFTFMDMLVLADMNGVVDITHEAIARRTNRPLEVIRKTISELESPDPRSRTPDHDGRRIKRLDEHRDWGWCILNYTNFRKIASEDQRREKSAVRSAKYRQKGQQINTNHACVTHRHASSRSSRHADADADADVEAEEKGEKAPLNVKDLKHWQLIKDLESSKKRLCSLPSGSPERSKAEEEFKVYSAEAKLRGLLEVNRGCNL